MKLFAKTFNNLLNKENVAGPGGAFGSGESGVGSSMGHGGAMTPAEDNFATKDARIPKGGKKGKKKKEKKHDGSIDVLVPLQKRPFVGM
jgi:hypothetical protein